MSFKIWLALSITVLMVHLALIQTVPLSLHSDTVETTSVFTTRTLSPTPQPITSPQITAIAQSKPIRRAQPKPAQDLTNTSNEAKPVENTQATANPPAVAIAEPIVDDRDANVPAEPTREIETTKAQPVAEQAPPSSSEQTSFSADGLPGSIKLAYNIESNRFPYSLHGELLWQQIDKTYQARLSFGAFGQSRVQTSRGLIGRDGLVPERFSDKYRSEVAAHFNQERGLVTFSANTPDVKLQVGAQDRLSILVQLAALVASAPGRYPPGSSLSVQTIGPRDADVWLFSFGNAEQLELPGGAVLGLKVERKPRQMYDQKVELWLSPNLSYMPARIRITESNGDYFDQKWVSSHPADAP